MKATTIALSGLQGQGLTIKSIATRYKSFKNNLCTHLIDNMKTTYTLDNTKPTIRWQNLNEKFQIVNIAAGFQFASSIPATIPEMMQDAPSEMMQDAHSKMMQDAPSKLT